MYKIMMVISDEIIIPINGANTMNAAILMITSVLIDSNPDVVYPFAIIVLMMAAPANPPISVCEEDEGIPNHQVARFHIIAATMPEKITGNVMYCSRTVFETVFAMPNPLKYLAMKKATKLKKAAHNTALKGVRTLVDTIVAIELAASWNPLI
jgi:hypothetical protein